nr:tRNA (guanine(37)-N1)-methyltransferase [Seculamonas ecuadoriensis]
MFDPSTFTRSLRLLALRVPVSRVGGIAKQLNGHMTTLAKIKCIVPDVEEHQPPTRLVLLSERYSAPDQLPDAVQALLTGPDALQLTEYPVTVGYDNMSAEEVLRQLLPSGMEIPHSFEGVGHIAHLNLRDEQLPFKDVIGRVLLDKNPAIRTVVNKSGIISSVYRQFAMEVLAGEPDFNVEVREHGHIFRFDYSQVYWNSRLSSEHRRLVMSFDKGDIVCDACCGVGPFAIPAAKAGHVVLANDLNPSAVEYLRENARLNKVANKIECFNMDARAFVRQLVADGREFHHVIMNLPALAVTFLDAFRGLYAHRPFQRLPRIHVYLFSRADDFVSDAVAQVEKYLGTNELSVQGGAERHSLHVFDVRNVAPKKEMMCVSFVLPASVATAEVVANGESDAGASSSSSGARLFSERDGSPTNEDDDDLKRRKSTPVADVVDDDDDDA